MSASRTVARLRDQDDVITTAPTNGQVPAWNATNSRFEWATPGGGGGGSGTVTSVGITVPTGFTAGSAITTTGVIAITTALSGILKGTGSGFAAATVNSDYLGPSSPLASANLTGSISAAVLPTSSATAGAYTNANVTVDIYGRVTAIANGTTGTGTVTSVGITVPAGLSAGSAITTSGVIAITTALSGILKGTGSGFAAAILNTDYLSPASPITSANLTGAISTAVLPTSGVTAGSYTNANIIVDSLGRVTTASNGTAGTGGTGAPTAGTYIVQVPTAGLTNAQTLSTLGTGLVKNTTATGVLTIAAAGTDYVSPTGFNFLLNPAWTLATGTAAVVAADVTSWYIVPWNCNLVKAYAAAKTAPTGASLILDIEKSSDGGTTWTSLWTTANTNRPTIAAGANTGNTTTFDNSITSLVKGDLLRVNIKQVGSTVAGSNITFVLATLASSV